MKLELDLAKKTIKLSEDVKLGALITVLDGMFPDDTWKAFTLCTNVTINLTNPIWQQPIVVRPYIHPYTTPYPWITYGTSGIKPSLEYKNYNETNDIHSIFAVDVDFSIIDNK